METANYKWTDLTYLKEIAEQDTAFMAEMVQDYLSLTPEQFEEMSAHFESGTYDQVKFIAHKLKSSFHFVGAKKLSEMAYTLEHFDMEAGRAEAAQLIADMSVIVKEVIVELQNRLTQLSHE